MYTDPEEKRKQLVSEITQVETPEQKVAAELRVLAHDYEQPLPMSPQLTKSYMLRLIDTLEAYFDRGKRPPWKH